MTRQKRTLCTACNVNLVNPSSPDGICGRCRNAWRCPVCGAFEKDKKANHWCQDCLAMSHEIAAIREQDAEAEQREAEPPVVARGRALARIRASVRQLGWGH